MDSSEQAFVIGALLEEGVELLLVDVTVFIGISRCEGGLKGFLVPLLIREL